MKGATVKGATLGMLQWLVDLAEPIAPRCEMSIMRGKRLWDVRGVVVALSNSGVVFLFFLTVG